MWGHHKHTVLDELKLFNDEEQELLVDKIDKVVFEEAPISLEECMKRVCESCSIDTNNSLVKEAFNKALKKSTCKRQKVKRKYWLWKNNQEPDDYDVCRFSKNRDINEICIKEIINAICYALEEKVVLEEKDLVIEAARCFELFNENEDIQSRIKDGIKEAKKRNLIKQNSEKKYIRI